MAQLKCPECGNKITTSMDSCPNCGYPLELVVEQQSEAVEQQSSPQNKLITLSKPIGILAIIMVISDIIGFFIFYPTEIESYSKVYQLLDYIGFFILLFFLMAWFLSLYGGSVKKSKMRTISVIALIGIILFLLYNMIVSGVFIRCDLLRNEYPNWWYNRGIILVFSLRYTLLGAAFLALGKFFHGKMNTYAILIGIGFLFRWVLMIVPLVYYLPGIGVIRQCLCILCYLFMALFFFGFNKTNKS